MKSFARKTTIQKEQFNLASRFWEFLEKRGINTSTFPDAGLKWVKNEGDLYRELKNTLA